MVCRIGTMITKMACYLEKGVLSMAKAKYPKRHHPCEHAEDFVCGCMWGSDGICDRPYNRKCILAEEKEIEGYNERGVSND